MIQTSHISKPKREDVYAKGKLQQISPRFENLVATNLFKRLNFIEDYHGYRCSLHYIRDKDGREVDFVTVINNEVVDLIEVKYADGDISPSLKYYTKMLKPKRALQIVGTVEKPYHQDNILVTNPIDFFKDPPWVEQQINDVI